MLNALPPVIHLPSKLSSIEMLPSAPLLKPPRYIWIIIGPAGCGKTTIAQFLSTKLNMPYIEGDHFHSPQNITKMSAGISLTDTDRLPWLTTLRAEALSTLSTTDSTGCIVSCSCLKRKYRDVFRSAGEGGVRVRFMYLRVEEAVVLGRVRARKEHYMKDAMVRGQFRDWEEVVEEEDVVVVDAGGARGEVEGEAWGRVVGCMREI